jgi:hypothetical protein
MDDHGIRDQIRAVELDVHSIKTDVAVLRSEFDTAMNSVVGIGKDVRVISDTLQQQQGAMKFVRIGWAAIGGLVAIAAVWIAYLSRQT